MKLHRDLGITQKHAWHLGHRLREAWGERERVAFEGEVEVDETFIGGLRKNKHAWKRRKLREQYGSGAGGKAVVAGARGRNGGKIHAKVVPGTDKESLQGFVADAATEGATIYSDGARAYKGIPQRHEAVDHSTGEYVREQAHTNGIEPTALNHRAPGYGIIKFDRGERSIEFANWPRWVDASEAGAKPYPGWPIQIQQTQSGLPTGYALPAIDAQGAVDPVVQVISEPSGEIVYTLRIQGSDFTPTVRQPGTYSVRVIHPESGEVSESKGLQARAQ